MKLPFTPKRGYLRFLLCSLLGMGTYISSQAQWTTATSGTTSDLSGVNYNNGLWVAVGGSTILTSSDGITWTSRNSNNASGLSDVQSNGSLWVAVGINGIIRTSPDGITWTARTSGTTQYLVGINYGGGQWIAVGFSGTIITSPDGVTWTVQNSGTTSFSDSFFDVSFGNGLWVVVGYNNNIRTSPDGITWTKGNPSILAYFDGVGYNGSLWVVVGYSGAVMTSSDGFTWSTRSAGTSSILMDASYGNGKWVIVGYSGVIRISVDGISWFTSTSGTTRGLYGLSYGGGTWVAVGEAGKILYSTDSALPVSLMNFQGKSDNITAHLSWQTSWETGASHFLIERSQDAKSFEPIGRVSAQGTTNLQQQYSFIDENLSSGLWYYRLREVDLDGTFTYSQIISVRIGNEPLETLTIYPNPSSAQLILEDKQGIRNVSLYSVKGELLHHQMFEKPVDRWTWDGTNQPLGTYLIRAERMDGTSQTQRWVKQ